MITLTASLYFFIAGAVCESLAAKHKDDNLSSTTFFILASGIFWPCYLVAKVFFAIGTIGEDK